MLSPSAMITNSWKRSPKWAPSICHWLMGVVPTERVTSDLETRVGTREKQRVPSEPLRDRDRRQQARQHYEHQHEPDRRGVRVERSPLAAGADEWQLRDDGVAPVGAPACMVASFQAATGGAAASRISCAVAAG